MSKLEVGEVIEAGIVGTDGRDRGTVQAVRGELVTVAWERGACVTTQPVGALADLQSLSRAAAVLGRKGGQAGRGAAKARPTTSEHMKRVRAARR